MKLYFTIPEIAGMIGDVEKYATRELVDQWVETFKDPSAGYGGKDEGYANVLVLTVDTETGDWETEKYDNVPEMIE